MKFTIAHFFCGIGGSALGTQAAEARFADRSAVFETIGGIDFDARACRDFERLTGAPALCADVHELEPAKLRKFLGKRAPDVVMMSPPCKGFSGLLSAKRAQEEKYQRMNALMLRSLFLVAETWKQPPSLVFVENVPRIDSRGKDMVRQSVGLLEAAGFAVTTGNHDCGELGGLAQHRRRWFMLARHRATVPQFVYQPPKHRVRACGEVLGPLPMPGDVDAAGPMHSVPKLSWRNWVRLALIPAGGDWRDLEGTLDEGQKRREKFRRAPVTTWDAPAATVTGPGGSASAAVADPRFGHVDKVTDWADPVGTITRSPAPSSGAAAVADPRWGGGRFGVNDWTDPVGTVAGDPRVHCQPRAGAYRVLRWEDAAATITGSLAIDNGAAAIADPRLNPDRPPPFTPMIIAADGTWHRPLTTLELAVLQSFPDSIDGVPLVLDGTSHTRWREAIGNAVPPAAAHAIGVQLLQALLIAKLGAFALDNNLIWVAPRGALVA